MAFEWRFDTTRVSHSAKPFFSRNERPDREIRLAFQCSSVVITFAKSKSIDTLSFTRRPNSISRDPKSEMKAADTTFIIKLVSIRVFDNEHRLRRPTELIQNRIIGRACLPRRVRFV